MTVENRHGPEAGPGPSAPGPKTSMAPAPPQAAPSGATPAGKPSFVRDAAIVVAIAWAVRLAVLVLLPAQAVSADVNSWGIVYGCLKEGANPYSATTALNWPPFWMQIVYCLGNVADVTGASFPRVLQAFLLGAESLVLLAFLRLSYVLAPGPAGRTLAIVALCCNPIAFLLVLQGGNFDVLVALWVILFLTSLCRFQTTGETVHWLWAALFLGLGILTKTVPLVLAPLLACRWRAVPPRTRLLGGVLAFGPVVLALSVLYVLAPWDVERHVFRYRSAPGYFGLSGLLFLAARSDALPAYRLVYEAATFAVMALVAAALHYGPGLGPRGLVLLAALLLAMIPALGPGYGPQYIYWFLPPLAATAPLYTIRWRRLLIGAYAVAILTYCVEYALFPSHGMFLVWLTHSAEPFLMWSERLSLQSSQTWVRAPLFLAYVLVLWSGGRLVTVDYLALRRGARGEGI